jgi:hypothetical protein
MKRALKIIAWALGITVGLVIGLVVVAYYFMPRDIATAYQPNCEQADSICTAWAGIRRAHPYPYQAIIGKRLPDGDLAIVIFEPPPSLSKTGLEDLTKKAFGSDFVSQKRLRWNVGVDGWVEDLVLKVKTHTSLSKDVSKDVLDDPRLRDQAALIYNALFGTTYGGTLNLVDEKSAAGFQTVASNLRLSPKEVSDWVTDSGLRWQRVGYEDGPIVTWQDITGQPTIGTFASADNTLVMLTLPTKLLRDSQTDPHALDSLRSSFRLFAVASDTVLGGLWNQNGQTAIVGRIRTLPLDQLPPLRFESFVLLAEQQGDELAQSYERNTIFSGKLESGEYASRDWAPIYLSEPLKDTELGALLNITDQMLKSWSEAGAVEYLYFTYPKPQKFPFDRKPLSTVLAKANGSTSVLFNWNTAGSAVVVTDAAFSALTTRQTGALPVTYGSDGKNHGNVQTGNLFTYEEKAYDYFANLRDPNLARVVQYTALYQLFRAITTDTTVKEATSHPNAKPTVRPPATELLVTETAKLISDADTGRLLRSQKFASAELIPKLKAFRDENPGVDNAHLASILVERVSEDARGFAEARAARLKLAESQLEVDVAKLDQDRAIVNRGIDEFNANPFQDKSMKVVIDAEVAELKAREAELKRRENMLEDQFRDDPIARLRHALWTVAQIERDLDAVRKEYVARSQHEPIGSIKTSSIVLSWNTHEIASVGGHNIDARALRLEMSSDVKDLMLVETDKGFVLRYNPSLRNEVAARATDLARAVEHGKVRDTAELAKLIAQPVTSRSRLAALEVPPRKPGEMAIRDRWRGQLGERVYAGKEPFVEDLRTLAAKNNCCIFVARDEQQVAFATKENPHPPPAALVFEIRDTPSLVEHLKLTLDKTEHRKPIVFFNVTESHAQALSLALAEGPIENSKLVANLADMSGSNLSSRVDGIIQADLKGRPSLLRSLTGTVRAEAREMLARLGVLEPKETWLKAKVGRLDRATSETLAKTAGWDTTRDGVPTGMVISFVDEATTAPEVAVVAGFERTRLAAGEASLEKAHQESLSAVTGTGGSIAQYVMTLRNDLRKIPDAQLKRLVVVARDKQTAVLLSRYVQMKIPNGD